MPHDCYDLITNCADITFIFLGANVFLPNIVITKDAKPLITFTFLGKKLIF